MKLWAHTNNASTCIELCTFNGVTWHFLVDTCKLWAVMDTSSISGTVHGSLLDSWYFVALFYLCFLLLVYFSIKILNMHRMCSCPLFLFIMKSETQYCTCHMSWIGHKILNVCLSRSWICIGSIHTHSSFLS